MPPPCQHQPLKARKGQRYDPTQDCPLCHHYLHREDYRRLWDGAPVPALDRTVTCAHQGGEVRRQHCPTCRGRVEVKVLACALHGECTPVKQIPEVACCHDCPDYRLPRDTFTAPPVRDLAYHLYPVKGNGRWRWSVEQLLRRIGLFNGRRVVAIVTDERTDPPNEVMEALRGEVDWHDFVVTSNDPGLREVKTLLPMLERLQTQDPNRCLLYAHGKGVTANGATSQEWAAALYEVMMGNWPLLQRQLEEHPLTGMFRWHLRQWKESVARWFYSGSWVWYRSRHLFARNWRHVERFWTGIEPYPAIHFSHAESGCVAVDEAGNVYDAQRWQTYIRPELEKWRQQCRS